MSMDTLAKALCYEKASEGVKNAALAASGELNWASTVLVTAAHLYALGQADLGQQLVQRSVARALGMPKLGARVGEKLAALSVAFDAVSTHIAQLDESAGAGEEIRSDLPDSPP